MITMTATATPTIRLLAGYRELGRAAGLRDHLARYGPVPAEAGERLVRAVDEAGLTGRGGAVPDLRAAARAVIVDAVDHEPASGKDRLLLTVAPHLVLDGAALVASAVGAEEIVVHADWEAAAGAEFAVAERNHAWLTEIPIRVRRVAGEDDGDRTGMAVNAETCAHIALIARHGPERFRECGTPEAPGTALFTVSGAGVRPGVVEAPTGTSVGALLRQAGGPSEPVQAILTGGYGGGTWLPPALLEVPATPSMFARAGVTLGPGVVIALPVRACGLAESARILAWTAGRNSGEPALAEDFAALVAGTADRDVHRRLQSLRPGDATRFALSALTVFGPHLGAHRRPGCPAASRPGVLPIPRER